MNPTIAIKNAVQEGRAVSLAPAALYRGYAVNLGMCAPITASFFGATAAYTQLFAVAAGRAPKGREGVGCAALGGATSALFAGPADLVVVQQQRLGVSAREAINTVVRGYGMAGLYRGALGTAMRDGVVLAGLLGLAPVISAELKELEATKSWSRHSQMLTASLVSGILGTAASMPFDASKTLQQAFLDTQAKPEYATIRSTLADMYAKGGVAALYAGGVPRGFRIICATFILNSVKEWAQEAIAALEAKKQS